MKMLSGLNNLKVFTVLSERYKNHFGFINEELDVLLATQGLSKDEDKVKSWYNGYQIGGLTLYNPYTGYLKVVASELLDTDYLCQLAIPNQEVLALYKSTFIEWLKQPSRRMQLKSLLEYLVEGQVERFVSLVSEFLLKAASFHDYAKQPEAFYHGFMLALTAGLIDDYLVESNPESGYGRPDLLFIPKDSSKIQAVILEFKPVAKGQKASTVAQPALAQIECQVYNAKLKQHPSVKTILCVGLAFDGKQVFHASRQQVL